MHGERGRIHNDAALAAAQRNVRYCAFPGHPRSKRADGVEGLVRGEADAAFIRATRIVVLDAVTLKDTGRAVVHAHRDPERILAHRPAQDFGYRRVQLQQFGYVIKLLLGHCKRIKLFSHDLLLIQV